MVVTALLWLVLTLSEHHIYPVRVNLSWEGFDSLRNVVMERDSVLTIDVQGNGFSIMMHRWELRNRAAVLNVKGDTVVRASDCVGGLMAQMGFQGVEVVKCHPEQLRLRLATLESRSYVPKLNGVEMSFAEGYGLYGAVRVVPDSVTLYGSRESLSKIDELRVAETELKGLDTAGIYPVALDPVWKKYADVRPSHREVQLVVGVEEYTERSYRVPVQVRGLDSGSVAKLYPQQVEVSFWVAERDFTRVSEEMFEAGVNYDPEESQWKVEVKRFPEFVRIKGVKPSAVQYVLFRK